MKAFSLIQLYFVLATMAGLILIIVGSVTLVRIGLDNVIGVKPYPDYTAPYPPTVDQGKLSGATYSQMQALAQWEHDYAQWQEKMKSYNAADQQLKRDIVQSLSMLLVGIPVFLIHSPKVFAPSKKQES
jgi:Lon protease-like protein